MRVCRKDDQTPRNTQQQVYSYPTSNQQYSSSNDLQNQQQYYYPQQQQQQQVYSNYPANYDQHYNTSPR